MNNTDNSWYIFIRTPQIENLEDPKDRVSRKGRPLGCVCLIRNDDGTFSRGISVCSQKDRFSKKIARNIAYNRAKANRNLTAISLGKSTRVRNYLNWVYARYTDQFDQTTGTNPDYENEIFPIAETGLTMEILHPLERRTISKD